MGVLTCRDRTLYRSMVINGGGYGEVWLILVNILVFETGVVWPVVRIVTGYFCNPVLEYRES